MIACAIRRIPVRQDPCMAANRNGPSAARDLAGIADYTIETFGIEQARRYRDDSRSMLSQARREPAFGPKRRNPRTGSPALRAPRACRVLCQGQRRCSDCSYPARENGCTASPVNAEFKVNARAVDDRCPIDRRDCFVDDRDCRVAVERMQQAKMNRPEFTGERLVQILGCFFMCVQGFIEHLLCFVRRDISDGAGKTLGVVPIDPFQRFPFKLAH